MIVVADASPLRYLILIEHMHVLPGLVRSSGRAACRDQRTQSRPNSESRQDLAGRQAGLVARPVSNNDLLGMMIPLGIVSNKFEPSDRDAVIMGIAVIVRILREKVEIMHLNVDALWEATQAKTGSTK